MNARTEYECEIISLFAKQFNELYPAARPVPKMSDADRNEEWLLQAQLENALRVMRQAIAAVNERSTVGVKIDGLAFEAFVHDECPNCTAWDEKISQGGIK